MRWFLLFTGLALAGAVVLGVLGRQVWRKARTCVRELTAAGDRLTLAFPASASDRPGPAYDRDEL